MNKKVLIYIIVISVICIGLLIGIIIAYAPSAKPLVAGNYSVSDIIQSDDGEKKIEAYLTVTAIDQATFEAANGVNVVEDVSKKSTDKYYSLQFRYTVNGSETVVEFVNLHTQTVGSVISYIDDNGATVEAMRDTVIIHHDIYDFAVTLQK